MTFALSHPYRLELPADPDLLMTARMFAAAVADQTDFADVVDDIKVAITEGMSLFIGNNPDSRPISLEVVIAEDRILFTIRGSGWIPEESDVARQPRTGMDLVRALFPSLALTQETDGTVQVSFDVALSGGDA